jgi:hypothetical protein
MQRDGTRSVSGAQIEAPPTTLSRERPPSVAHRAATFAHATTSAGMSATARAKSSADCNAPDTTLAARELGNVLLPLLAMPPGQRPE